MKTPEEFLRDKGINPTTIVAYHGTPLNHCGGVNVQQLMQEYAEYYDTIKYEDAIKSKQKPQESEEELIPVPDDIVFKKLGGKIALVSPNGKLEMRREDGIEEANTWAARPSAYGKRIYPKGLRKINYNYNELHTGNFCIIVPSGFPRPLRTDQIELVVKHGFHKRWDGDENVVTVRWDDADLDDGDWYKVIF